MSRGKTAVKFRNSKDVLYEANKKNVRNKELLKKILNRVGTDEILDFICGCLKYPTDIRSEYLKNLLKYDVEIVKYGNKKYPIKLKGFSNSNKEATTAEIKAYRDIMSNFLNDIPNAIHPFEKGIIDALLCCGFASTIDVVEKDNDEFPQDKMADIIMFVTEHEYPEVISTNIDFISKLFKLSDEQRKMIEMIIQGKINSVKINITQESYSDIEKLNVEFKEKIDSLQEEKRQLNDKIKILKSENEELEKRKELDEEEYINHVETLRLRNEVLENQIEELNGQIEELNIKIEEFEERVLEKEKVSTKQKTKSKSKAINETDFVASVRNVLASKGLCYDADDIYNFHISLKSSPLTILAGKSGLGKTRLPLAYAECINAREDDGTLLFLPISPSYTEPSDVLGFYNIAEGKYQPASTGFVDFLIHASEHQDRMHMVIFDEMNLSQIEYWFAPFMSLLEKPLEDRNLILYSAENTTDDNSKYPPKIHIGENIIFVGTVNLDETTKDMSDRLIDRAIVINLKKQSFIDFYNQEIPEIDNIIKCESFDDFESMKNRSDGNYIKILSQREVEFLDELHNMLQKHNSSKGVSFRNVYKISNYLMESPNNNDFNRKLAFDLIFKQTILKKLNGYDASISKILGKLDDDGEIVEGLLMGILYKYGDVSAFTNTKKEIKNKIKEFDNYGFTR